MTATLAGLGATVIVANGPAVLAALTTTVADPDTLPLVARIVAVPGVAGAVYMPVGVIVPAPLATDHVGVMATTFPAASRAVAVNCIVPDVARVSLAAETTMLAGVPPPGPEGGPLSLAQEVENMTTAIVPAMTR